MKKELNTSFYVLRIALFIGIFFFHSAEAFGDNLLGRSNLTCTIDLPELMISFAGKKERSARFKEEKFLKILNKPLRSEGILRFRAPDYLEKITLKPKKERLVLNNEFVTISGQHNKPKTFSLDDYPPLRELLNGIRFILSGNLDALTKYYDLDLKGNCNQWSLILIPISASALEIMDRFVILGREENIQKITWVESNGDFTIMTIEKESS